MADPIRERIAAALATRMGASRAWRRPDAPTTVLWMGGDERGEITPYGAQQAQALVTVERAQMAAAATADPEADALAAERAGEAMLADLIADMGTADVTDGTSPVVYLCDAPVYESGEHGVASANTGLIGAVARFRIAYLTVRGDPYTPGG